MILHLRSLVVQKAHLSFGEATIRIIREHGLTAAEVCSLLLQELSNWHRYVMRGERHPGADCDAKADEKCDNPDCEGDTNG